MVTFFKSLRGKKIDAACDNSAPADRTLKADSLLNSNSQLAGAQSPPSSVHPITASPSHSNGTTDTVLSPQQLSATAPVSDDVLCDRKTAAKSGSTYGDEKLDAFATAAYEAYGTDDGQYDSPYSTNDTASASKEEILAMRHQSLLKSLLGKQPQQAASAPLPDVRARRGGAGAAAGQQRRRMHSGGAASIPPQWRHLGSLCALLPARVVEQLVAGREGGQGPQFRLQRFESALLFIDISGFTACMERFASRGAAGIEKFWTIINSYFNHLLNYIQGTGGDVDCFAGDALLVVYNAAAMSRRQETLGAASICGADGEVVSPLLLAALAACQCGGILLDRLSPYAFEGGEGVPLTLHGSIGAGDTATVEVGGVVLNDVSEWETFCCGPVIEQLAIAQDLSGKSEFCLSSQVAAMVARWIPLQPPTHGLEEGEGAGGCMVITGLQPKCHRADQQPLEPLPSFYTDLPEATELFCRLQLREPQYAALDKILQMYLPESMVRKFKNVQQGTDASSSGGAAGDSSWLGELRQASVGFVKFDILDINKSVCSDFAAKVQHVSAIVMAAFREVHIAGGHVNKVIMDEKGLVLLYAFGMPGYSYENNNLHAVRVALEIKDTARRDFRHRVGVGVASGQICCGLIGKGDFRCEYALAGDMVNLAARLAARADAEHEGCVLCDQFTIQPLIARARELLRSITVKSFGRMRPKGKSYDVEVFQVSRARQLSVAGIDIPPDEFTSRAARAGAPQGGNSSAAGSSVQSGYQDRHSFVSVVGREVELAAISAAVKASQEGALTCCILEGEAGMGKSTLVPLLREKLSERPPEGQKAMLPMHVVEARADHLEQGTPYYVLSDIVKGLIGLILPSDGTGRIDGDQLREALVPEVHRLVPLLKFLNIRLQEFDPASRKDRNSKEGGGRSANSSANTTSFILKERERSELASARRSSSNVSYTASAGLNGTGGLQQQPGGTTSGTSSSNAKRGGGGGNSKVDYRFRRFNASPSADTQPGRPGAPHQIGSFMSVVNLTIEAATNVVRRMQAGIATIISPASNGAPCFTEAHAVAWMLKMRVAGSVAEALALGTRLLEYDLIFAAGDMTGHKLGSAAAAAAAAATAVAAAAAAASSSTAAAASSSAAAAKSSSVSASGGNAHGGFVGEGPVAASRVFDPYLAAFSGDAGALYQFAAAGAPRWEAVRKMTEASATALAFRMSLELVPVDCTVGGQVRSGCFTGESVAKWMAAVGEASCIEESCAMCDRLLKASMLEPVLVQGDRERLAPTAQDFYCVHRTALNMLPPAETFPILRRLCMALLRAAVAAASTRKTLIIFVDDLHWADRGSLDMVAAMLREGRATGGVLHGGVAFLLASRPEAAFPVEHRPWYARLRTMREVSACVALTSLSEEAEIEMACGYLGVDELDSELRKLISSTCSGNPFFVREMCSSLAASGALQTTRTSSGKERAIIRKASKETKSVPISVQEIVAARIDTLDSGLALVLKVASVLGETFTFDLLSAVFPIDIEEETLRMHLADLMARNFFQWSTEASPESSGSTPGSPGGRRNGGHSFGGDGGGGNDDSDDTSARCYRFAHALMSYTAYGMLLHSYRWRLHYRVALVTSEMNNGAFMVLAHHWLQVAKFEPSRNEIDDFGGEEAFGEILHRAIATISKAIQQLLGLGQFIDASTYFVEALEVVRRLQPGSQRDALEIGLLLQGCQLTQFMEGYTDSLLRYAQRALEICCRPGVRVPRKQKVRAGLFIAQHGVMVGDLEAAVGQLAALYEETPADNVLVRLEPAAILAAILVQRGDFDSAKKYTAELKGWEQAKRPTPLCLGMYEPVVTLMTMNVVMAALQTDDSSHQHWMNQVERYLKDSPASNRPFHLYASMSLFGTLFPVCVEVAEMVRFYHAVYRVVYHPQVLLPIRRGLLYQAPTAASRVQADNPIVTQGIEVMSLMCKIFETVHKEKHKGNLQQLKKAKQAFNELMGVVRRRPAVHLCAAVYQAARVMHEWPSAHEIIELWQQAALSAPPRSVFTPLLPYHQADLALCELEDNELLASAEDSDDGESQDGDAPDDDEQNNSQNGDGEDGSSPDSTSESQRMQQQQQSQQQQQQQLGEEVELTPAQAAAEAAAKERCAMMEGLVQLLELAIVQAREVNHGLMEVRATTELARILSRDLGDKRQAQKRLEALFDVYQDLCPLPNYFAPVRLEALASAMALNNKINKEVDEERAAAGGNNNGSQSNGGSDDEQDDDGDEEEEEDDDDEEGEDEEEDGEEEEEEEDDDED